MEERMDALQRRQALEAANAAARRLLLCAIDIRFDLEEVFEADPDGHRLSSSDLHRLRAAAGMVQDEIERLAQMVHSRSSPPDGGADGEDEIIETFHS
jgi:hypothetical protein